MPPDPSFLLNTLALLAVASGVLSNITVIVVSLRGRPTVRKDEFDEHKVHVSGRFAGVNSKIDDIEREMRGQLADVTTALSAISSDMQRNVGRLEGAVNALVERHK